MVSGVYVIECAQKQYVGSAHDIKARWAVHRNELRHNQHHSRYLQRAWNKHGEEAFVFRILEVCAGEQCVEREQYWIDTLRPKFNMHPLARSPLGVKRSNETRAKLSVIASKRVPPMAGKHHSDTTKAKMRGRIVSEATREKLRNRVVSAETRAKLSAAKVGVPRSRAAVEASAAKVRGRKRTPEQVEALRQRLIGVKHSPERCAINRAAHIGQVITPEHRAKISAAFKGRSSPLKGRTLTPEHRAKISAAGRARNLAQRQMQQEPGE